MTTMMRRATKMVVVAMAVIALAGCARSGGDPNGTVLQSLKQTTRVVPSTASNVSVRSLSSVWTSPCPEFPGAHAGWSADQVFISFTDSTPSSSIISHVDAALGRLGWHRHDTVITQGQGPVPHWTLRTPNSPKAHVFAFQAPPMSGHWAVDSSWQPPGPKAEGCP